MGQPSRHDIIEYYSNERIAQQLLKDSKNREIAGAFMDGRYDKRPNIIQYPSDVVQMAKKGVTSFHYSVEHWSNPMALSSDNYTRLRTGWDMIIDIDSKLSLDESKIAAKLIIKLLEKYGLKKVGVKFSGRRGFHICIPFDLFPKEIDYKPLAGMYPDALRILASFIRTKIRKRMLGELVRTKGAKNLIEMIGEAPSRLNPFYFVEVEKSWGNRHMFRAPYSFNEKTWLVSLPVPHINSFLPKDAEYEKVLSSYHPDFFGATGDATDLLTDAMDWYTIRKKQTVHVEKKAVRWEQKVQEELFPPCIKLILAGLDDGKKRSIFTLVNFLRMMNWTNEEIEQKINEWNSRNRPPLPGATVLSTLRYHERRTLTPANCFNGQFYTSFGVCRPDEVCKFMNKNRTSNPVAYPFKKMKPSKKKVVRGFSCLCGKEFPSMRSLEIHKGRRH